MIYVLGEAPTRKDPVPTHSHVCIAVLFFFFLWGKPQLTFGFFRAMAFGIFSVVCLMTIFHVFFFFWVDTLLLCLCNFLDLVPIKVLIIIYIHLADYAWFISLSLSVYAIEVNYMKLSSNWISATLQLIRLWRTLWIFELYSHSIKRNQLSIVNAIPHLLLPFFCISIFIYIRISIRFSIVWPWLVNHISLDISTRFQLQKSSVCCIVYISQFD